MKHKETHQRDFQWAEIGDRPTGAAGLNSQVKRPALPFNCFSRLPFEPAVSDAQSLCKDLQGVLWSSLRSWHCNQLREMAQQQFITTDCQMVVENASQWGMVSKSQTWWKLNSSQNKLHRNYCLFWPWGLTELEASWKTAGEKLWSGHKCLSSAGIRVAALAPVHPEDSILVQLSLELLWKQAVDVF